MVLQHALEHRAQVVGRREVAALIEIGGFQARPVRDHPAALHRAAGKQRDGAGAVVGAFGAVDARGAAEFGGNHDHGVAPARAEPAFELRQRAVETAEQLRQTPGGAAFIGVGIPAVEGERGDARAVIGRHQFGGAARHQFASRPAPLLPGFGFMSSPCAALSSCRPCDSALARAGSRWRIEIDQPHRGVVGGLRQRHRRPGHRRRSAAQHQRRGRADRKPAHDALAPGQHLQRAVEPAGLHPARSGIAAFEHVLAVEMRAVAIGRRHRMNHRGLLLAVHPRRSPASPDAGRRRSRACSPPSARSNSAQSNHAGRHNQDRRSARRWRGRRARRAGSR